MPMTGVPMTGVIAAQALLAALIPLGLVTGLACVLALRRARAQLRAAQDAQRGAQATARALRALIDAVGRDIVLRVDRTGAVVQVLAGDRAIVARPSPLQPNHSRPDPLRASGGDLFDLFEVPDPAALRARLERPGGVPIELRAVRDWGAAGWFALHAVPATDVQGEGAFVLLRAIDDRKQLEQRLREASLTDPLTGLDNRLAFMARLDARIAAGEPACLALIALDHLRAINDRHGHAAGDAVLRAFAQLARSLIRSTDTLARIGGETFALILPHADPEQAELVTRRIVESFAASARAVGSAIVRSTASAGVAAIEGDATQAIGQAELALFAARARGRDRVELAGGLRRLPGARW